MNKQEFEQFVIKDGKDILRFCRMNAGDTESGNELYQDTMLTLPEKYRVPIYLSYSAGMKMQEIAECLQLPLSTVKTRIRKAKALLKEQLEAIGYDG